jgi:hypothetical protein
VADSIPTRDGSSDRRSSASSNARSLFEASAYRVAAHSSSSNGEDITPDEDHGGVPDKFLEEYIAALRDSNGKWATETDIADLFASNAKMITQDKKTHEGKSNVLKRLDQGKKTKINTPRPAFSNYYNLSLFLLYRC